MTARYTPPAPAGSGTADLTAPVTIATASATEKALILKGSSGAPPGASPGTLSGLRLWLKADALSGRVDGDPVATWPDSSGLGNDAAGLIGSGDAYPIFKAAVIGTKPALRFSDGPYYTLPNFMVGATSGEQFLVVRTATDPPEGNVGVCWQFGAGDSRYRAFGNIYDSFGSTSTYQFGCAADLSQWHVYGSSASASAWSARIDGASLHAETSNSVGWTPNPQVGANPGISHAFIGDIAEVIVFGRELTSGERADVQDYLNLKYGLGAAGAGQSAPLQEWQNSAGLAQSAVDGSGYHVMVIGSGPPASAPADGAIFIEDGANSRVWVRVSGAWKFAALATLT